MNSKQQLIKKRGTFIDVREAKDYEKGHVAGAKNIDVKNIDKDLAALLPADKKCTSLHLLL